MASKDALKDLVAKIQKEHGAGAVMMDDGTGAVSDVTVIPTGAMPMDLQLGIGGMPLGRIAELYGPESSGKTTLMYHIIANAQKMGYACAFIDAEHSVDKEYASRIGVNFDELLFSQPDHGDQALQIAAMMVDSGLVKVVVIDSVAALVPKAEVEGEIGDSFVGLQARLMSQAMRTLSGAANRQKAAVLFTNQLREKIGVMFGSPETTPGGRALKFYASIRMDIRRIETLKEGEEAVGQMVRVKFVKNKLAPPNRQAEFPIRYGFGIDRPAIILGFATDDRKNIAKSAPKGMTFGIVAKAGGNHTFPNGDKAKSGAAAREYVIANPTIADQMEDVIRRRLSGEDVDLSTIDWAPADAKPEADAAAVGAED